MRTHPEHATNNIELVRSGGICRELVKAACELFKVDD
jgi:hypothetical protein